MAVRVEVAQVAEVPSVHYRWDRDTDGLCATVDTTALPARDALGRPDDDAPPLGGGASSGAIEVEGADGSWLSLELSGGRIGGVQVAVWPTVRRRSGIAPPSAPARAVYVAGAASGEVALEMSACVLAETDADRRHFHFRFGAPRAATCARIATDVLLEVDAERRLAGLWLLNVPPFPDDP